MLRTVFAMAVAGLVFGAVSGTAQAAVAALIALAIRQIVFRPRAQVCLLVEARPLKRRRRHVSRGTSGT